MRASRLGLLISALLITSACSAASADVGDYSQDVKITNELPVSGYFAEQRYRDVLLTQTGSNCGHRVGLEGCYKYTTGDVAVKLRTYKVVEELRGGYDLFVVVANIDVDVDSASTGVSNMYFNLITNAKVVDYVDTSGKSASANECRSIDLSISRTIGPLDAGADLGSVRFCSEAASLVRRYAEPSKVAYKAHHFNKFRSIQVARVVKVERDVRPKFRLDLQLRRDVCFSTFGSDTARYCYEPGEQRDVVKAYSIGS